MDRPGAPLYASRAQLLAIALLLLLSAASCRSAPPARDALRLCSDCGHLAGTPECCILVLAPCPTCGLNESSPGHCSELLADGDVLLCAACGHPLESERCCADGAERCASCGFQTDALLCCKRWNERAQLSL